ncbi:MAG: hypothetical protein R3F30_10690 [Planctomycetota bacterium]
MAGGLQKKLQDAVRKLSYKTSVDQLKQRGIHKVNVVGLDRIVALVEAAVHRTLKARLHGYGADLGPASTGSLAEATREEFLRLLRSNAELEKVHEETKREKAELEGHVDRLRLELLQLQQELEAKHHRVVQRERIRAAATDVELFGELERLFEQAGRPEVYEEVRELLASSLDRERQLLAEARMAEHRVEVETLERRILKLNETLRRTEDRLREAESLQELDPGISSIYREVQGLSHADLQYEKKRGLMLSIFEANVALQQVNQEGAR